jgi:LacI family transcriptional regulator
MELAEQQARGEPVHPRQLPFVDAAGRVTLRTIAALSDVHVTTVSRVLNPAARSGSRAASLKTSERIRRLARELGYVPNPHATSLRTQQSNLVGVLAPRLSDVVFAMIYEGLDEAAGTRGLHTFVTNSRDDPQQRRDKAEMLLGRHVDGLVIGDAAADAQFVDELHGRGVPFVLVSRHAGAHPSVTCDDYLGGRLAAEHLLELGHERPAVIAGEPFASTGIDRTAGFTDRYAEAGLAMPETWVCHSHFDVQGGRSAAAELLKNGARPTAVFAVNDFAAIGALGPLREAGLHVGQDVALVGFNDIPLAAELPLPLTSVHSEMHEMGRQAVDLLVERLAGRPAESRRLRPWLVVRESSCPAPRSGRQSTAVRRLS